MKVYGIYFKSLLLLLAIAITPLFVSGCFCSDPEEQKDSQSNDNRVLIINWKTSEEESFGIEAFNNALKRGGQVPITLDEVIKSNRDYIEQYCAIVGKDDKYLLQGAIINYIIDNGWRLHSSGLGILNFESATIFERAPK